MSLHFEEKGNKAAQTIIFIHGGGISSWMWGKQIEHFKDYHCILPDLPEHGKSFNERRISIKESARQIAELIEKHANGGRAYIVGHSLGAKIIVELLSIRPELIISAVAASALFRPIPYMKWSHKQYIYKLTASMMKYKWMASLTVSQFKFPDKTCYDSCIKEFQHMTADTLYRIYDELYHNLNLPKGLEKADVPVLVIAGEKEPKAMRQSVVDMVNILPNARGILIKKGLHTYPWVMYENFNRIVEDWINNRELNEEFIINQ